ncbi:MAG: phage Gp37/Gp68 family protein [Dysgonamonadaceae bacterium]|jgi:protein gp37|nr:phage Gp37/Gp68 family protein [Dysgonamonadaceae bacterium]
MKTTKIEWTEATWNPSIGCSKVTAGCKNCYAEVMARRLQAMGTVGYEKGFEFTLLPDRLTQPMSVKKPTKFFVNSMSDLFHEEMPFEYLDLVFDTIRKTPQHHYQILTKREHILHEYFSKRNVPENVWLGVTVEHANTKHRIDFLRKIDTNIRFLSIEPLIGDVGELDLTGIHWVIVGGESGMSARPMKPEWVANIQKQCKEQNVAFFFKQWGTWGEDGVKRNKKENGSKLFGQEWKEEPKCNFNYKIAI